MRGGAAHGTGARALTPPRARAARPGGASAARDGLAPRRRPALSSGPVSVSPPAAENQAAPPRQDGSAHMAAPRPLPWPRRRGETTWQPRGGGRRPALARRLRPSACTLAPAGRLAQTTSVGISWPFAKQFNPTLPSSTYTPARLRLLTGQKNGRFQHRSDTWRAREGAAAAQDDRSAQHRNDIRRCSDRTIHTTPAAAVIPPSPFCGWLTMVHSAGLSAPDAGACGHGGGAGPGVVGGACSGAAAGGLGGGGPARPGVEVPEARRRGGRPWQVYRVRILSFGFCGYAGHRSM